MFPKKITKYWGQDESEVEKAGEEKKNSGKAFIHLFMRVIKRCIKVFFFRQ